MRRIHKSTFTQLILGVQTAVTHHAQHSLTILQCTYESSRLKAVEMRISQQGLQQFNILHMQTRVTHHAHY